uniref:Si:ch211-63p21.8 n=1 Tax=Cyprinus carpio TaxID=7962 RepID=A0A8C2IAJ5_CYPCA
MELVKLEEGGGNKEEKLKKISAEDQMKVNLVLLAASSDYFRGMFTSGMKESQQESVPLLLVGAAELETLLRCAYSGTLVLGWGCVFELACTSLQFQFQPAISLCLKFLEQEMDIHNCLDVASFAEAYGMADLLELAEDFVLRRFQEISATPKFQDLPAEKLLQFLRCDALSTPSELAVFRAVVTWVEADPTERLPQAEELMRAVRFPFMTFREFREVRAVNLSMECSGEVEVELYKSALKEFGFGISDRQLWFANSLRSGTGLVKEIEWRLLADLHELRSNFMLVVICNLRKYYTDQLVCEMYNPVSDIWTVFTPLPIPHVGAASAILEERLYILGGYCQEDYSEARLTHRYDPVMQRWESMGKMPGAVTDVRACLLSLPNHIRKRE